MSMLAMGCNFALVGSTQEEFEFVQNIIVENRKLYEDGEGFYSQNGPGSVITVDSLDTSADYDIGLDLSVDGEIRVKSMCSQRIGSVSYIVTDRRNLLYQLVIMHIGFKFADVPFNEIMDIFVKGCEFRYIDCVKNEYLSSLRNIMAESTKNKTTNQDIIFIQMIDPPGVAVLPETEELMDEFGYLDGLLQVITYKDDSISFQSGVFLRK